MENINKGEINKICYQPKTIANQYDMYHYPKVRTRFSPAMEMVENVKKLVYVDGCIQNYNGLYLDLFKGF